MCGRYLIASPPEVLRALFGYPDQPNFPPRYNVAPTQPVPIVRMAEGVRRFALVRWGLLPSWVKDPAAFTLLINGRGETVNEKPAFRNAMKRRRCLFPADGFYEWKNIGGRKRAYVARPVSEGPVAFAGLWETWTGPNGEEVETAAIVTTQANAEMASIHHRAPVIVPPQDFDTWMDCGRFDVRAASELLKPAPDGTMDVYEVAPAVNKVINDSPDLLEPFTAPPEPETAAPAKPVHDDRQGSLF